MNKKKKIYKTIQCEDTLKKIECKNEIKIILRVKNIYSETSLNCLFLGTDDYDVLTTLCDTRYYNFLFIFLHLSPVFRDRNFCVIEITEIFSLNKATLSIKNY